MNFAEGVFTHLILGPGAISNHQAAAKCTGLDKSIIGSNLTN